MQAKLSPRPYSSRKFQGSPLFSVFFLLTTNEICRLLGLTPDEAVFEELIKQLDGKLHGYEAILSKRKYLGGDVRLLSQARH